MLLLLTSYLVLSMILLLGASELERRAIVDRRIGPNGRALLVALVASAVAALGVTAVTAYMDDWVTMLHVFGGMVLYHGIMGIFLVHGLQKVSARVAGHALG
ncbi:hypothetical protein [Rhodovulum adriaticum]|uniref:Uncharacterized protein n=1 Tax=Rhodovulum adriaticum TaxID=35804 RepID=A0A4V2SMB2_RHOAD|nr:hypothetical protein [Rhodovulum adriaticum]MBK1636230.1 hypothetical protein [Rhodovulum adriaticum]TCP26516.1 hypothetical protein EV656_102485 [Rhodovulum adriaticum]